MAESFGSYLKQERELRKISLQEVSEETHIKLDYLEAMETEHFEKLPGLTFARGYLRAYAAYVGLIPEEVLLHFEEYIRKLSGGKSPRQHNTNPRLFWLVTFLILVMTSSIILIWFRK